MGGGKGDTPTPTPSPYEESLANIANGIYNQTNPLRQAFINQLTGFVTGNQQPVQTQAPLFSWSGGSAGAPTTGGMWRNVDTGAMTTIKPQGIEDGGYIYDINNPTQIVPGDENIGMRASRWEPMTVQTPQVSSSAPQTSNDSFSMPFASFYNPVYAAGKSAVEGAYKTGKDQLLANAAPGGAIAQGLTNLELGRASDLTNLQSGVAQDLFNKAYGLATGTPGQAMSGLGTAAGIYSGQQSQMYSANQQAGTGMGMLAGSLLGRGLFGSSNSGILSGGKGATTGAGKGAGKGATTMASATMPEELMMAAALV